MRTHFDLFSGIGGFALSCRWAGGIETIGFSEIDEYCSKILRKHWPGVPNYGDIHELSGEKILQLLCNANAQDVKLGQLGQQDHIVSPVIQNELRHGEELTSNIIAKAGGNIMSGSEDKLLRTTEGGARAAVNLITNSLPLITSSTMGTRKGKHTKLKPGNLHSSGGCQTITASFATTATKQERTLEYAHTRKLWLLSAGFPCQPYSLAGKRRGKEDNRALWPQIVRLLHEMDSVGILPTWCLFENVPGIIGMELDNIISDLEGKGYTVWPVVVPACAVDARHRRDRIWILANRDCGSRGAEPWQQQSKRPEVVDRSREGNVANPESQRPGEARGLQRERPEKWIAGGGETLADTDEIYWRQQQFESCKGTGAWDEFNRCSGEALSNASIPRLEKRSEQSAWEEREAAERSGEALGDPDERGVRRARTPGNGRHALQSGGRQSQSELRRMASRLPEGLDRAARWPEEWEGVPRISKGVKNRVHRLKALGNSIVPQVAEKFIRWMREAEEQGEVK